MSMSFPAELFEFERSFVAHSLCETDGATVAMCNRHQSRMEVELMVSFV